MRELVRDVIIGMSDGLTVPFALAAGLSASAEASSSIIVTAGIAEVAAGAIAMGLGGYLAAASDMDHYKREEKREKEEILALPDTGTVLYCTVLSEACLNRVKFLAIFRPNQKNLNMANDQV